MRILFTLIMLVMPSFLHASAEEGTEVAGKLWPSSTCRDCHVRVFDQHMESMHASSFIDPVFQSQYVRELMPKISDDEALARDAEGCIRCHSPVTYSSGKKVVTSIDQVIRDSSGVTCDFCHTLKGYEGDAPGNGNYISEPSAQKLGPFKTESSWHHAYSELHTKSEFCAICHNMVNRHGLEIKATYAEWKNSKYAEAGIHCQDCHMNARGFLVADKPVFESGKSSNSQLGYSPHREKLYTHRFPGSHAREQVKGAISLGLESSSSQGHAGKIMHVKITIDNSRTGHNMPTGSSDLRFMYLEVKAITKDRVVSIPAKPVHGQTGYDVTGFRMHDAETLGTNIPVGMRIYRSIFVDGMDRPTLSSYDAVKIVFDNRIEACEIREEHFNILVPSDAGEFMDIEARLYYVPYPASFADQLDLPEPRAFEIAYINKRFHVQ